ncbi:MAG TPA: winged helix DNA-binding domain-containing protein [Candidatus Methylacidiphilales bacterium]
MTALDVALHRLHNQQIAKPLFKKPHQVVASLGAVQAQDFPGTKWAIGLRLSGATEKDIDHAIASRSIIRTWPMRGTLHFVAAEDVHWMRALLTPRIIAGSTQRQKNLELDAKVFARCEKLLIKALQGDRQLAREAICALLEKAGISTAGQRGYDILWRLAQEGLLCFGAPEGKQHTFALLDEWSPATKSLERDEALAQLAKRYFTGHGPATLQDFVWWSGLKVSDARAGLNMVSSQLAQETVDGKIHWMPQSLPALSKDSPLAHLLPGFDEYMLGYTDRSAALDPKYAQRICPGSNGIFSHTVVLNGRVSGIWKRSFKKETAILTLSPFTSFSKIHKNAITIAADRYGKFMEMTARCAE